MAAQTLDSFLPGILTQDTKKRIEAGEELVIYLQNDSTSLSCEEMDKLVDGLTAWVSSSNFKVSLQGQEALSCLIDRMSGNFKPHVTTVLPAAVDRLGDSKDQVRESAKELLLKLMSPASTPQYVIDRLTVAFTHKLWKVKEETLLCLQRALNDFGAKSIGLSKIVPSVVKLLDDQSIPVREQAVSALVEIYRHAGEKVRNDIAKKDINPSRLNQIFAKMDEVKNSGRMIAASENSRFDDESDSSQTLKVAKRSTSSTRTSAVGSKSSKTSTAPAASGAIDEDTFIRSFEDVPKIFISSAKDVCDRFSRIRDVLSDANNDWEKRNDALKEVRSLFVSGASNYPDFQQQLRTLEACFRLSVQDLRSQVVRETCITIAYMAQQLAREFDHFAEAVVPALVQLIPNTAKIMATSGTIALRFIVQYTHVGRLTPLITCNLASKNNIIRKQCLELVDQMLRTWPSSVLEKQASVLQEAIKKGLTDADPEARAHSRRAYWGFEEHFKQMAATLFNTLDSSQQKLLQGASSNSSSTNSLNNPTNARQSVSSAKDVARTSGRVSTSTQPQRSTVQSSTSKAARIPKTSSSAEGSEINDGGESIGRSNSTANLMSHVEASRVSSAADYSSLPRQKKSRVGAANGHVAAERTRSHSKAQSQPGSRSTSPSSRLSYITNLQPDVIPTTSGKATRVLARSQGPSRDTSPSRTSHGARDKRSIGASRVAVTSQRKDLSSAPRLLQPGEDMESAVATALLHRAGSFRRRTDNGEGEDACSETSSQCSEGSYRSYGNMSEDMNEIITSLSSGSWADRRDGLISLQNALQTNRYMSRAELKKVLDLFTRMFHDPHGKVFSAFMETLVDLINIHKLELYDWLYLCLPRLINKLGTDLLGSVQTKVQKVLDIIRVSFEGGHQFNILAKFIVDQTQSPNLKVKVKLALLNYLYGLSQLMDPAELANTSDTRLAMSRIITWMTEPKSAEVRKAAQALLIAFHNLNPSEFSLMVKVLPKTFQDGANRILQNVSLDAEPLSPRNVTSPTTGGLHHYRMTANRFDANSFDTENMNPEQLYNSFKKTSADIQNLSRLDFQFSNSSRDSSSHEEDLGFDSRRHFSPGIQDEEFNGMNASGLVNTKFDLDHDIFNEEFPVDQIENISDIIQELSDPNAKFDERRNALANLIKITRDGKEDIWTEHFKTILLILLETLVDPDDTLKTMALRALREIIQRQPERFKDYAELAIMKILQVQKDSQAKEVVRIAEECAAALAHAIPADQCIMILSSLTESIEFPMSLAAIKMQIKVIELISDKAFMLQLLPQLVPSLLKGYDNSESRVRKASVFCLVAVYLVVGDDLRPHLDKLSGSKMKLLNLYIKRGLAQKGEDSSDRTTSKTNSPLSMDLV